MFPDKKNLDDINAAIELYNEEITTKGNISKDNLAILKNEDEVLGTYFDTLNGKKASLEDYNALAAKADDVKGLEATANKANTASWKTLTASVWDNIKAMAAWMVSNPIGQIMLLAGAIYGVTKIYDAVTISTEEWYEKLAQANQALSESIQEYNQIDSELQSVNARITELQNKGPLTITEKGELETLQKQNAELERQLALKDLDRQNKQKDAVKTFVKTMESDLAKPQEKESRYTQDKIDAYYEQHPDDRGNISLAYNYGWVNEEEYIRERFDLLSDLQEQLSTARTQEERDRINKEIEDTKTYLEEKIMDLNASVGEIQYVDGENLDPDQEKANRYLSILDTMNDKLLLFTDKSKNAAGVWNSIWTRDQFSDAQDAIKQLSDDGKLTTESLSELYSNNDDVKELVDYLDSIGAITIDQNGDGKVSAEELAQAFSQVITQVERIENKGPSAIRTFSDTLSDLSAAEQNIDSLKNALGEFNDNGTINTDTLNDLYNRFQNVPNVDQYINTLANASSTDEATQAIQSLSTAYLYSTGILDQVNESNKTLITTRLQAMGVANAQELVERKLTADTMGLANATAAEATAILKTSTASDTTKKAIADYTLSKQTAKLAAMNFSTATFGEIQALKGLATQAGYTGKVLQALQKIEYLKNWRDNVDRMGLKDTKGDRQQYRTYESDLAAATSELQSLLSKGNPKIDFNNLGDGCDTGPADQWKEAAESAFRNLEHRHNMGKISEKAYLDELERLNNKYYKNSTEYASEYQSNLERIRSGRLQLTRDNFAKEQTALQRRRDLGKISEWNYLKELEKLNNKYYKNKKDFEEDYQQNLDEILQGRMSLYQDAYDKLNSLVDKQVEIIKSEKEARKKALQDQLSDLKNFYDKQKQMLRDEADEEKYQKDQAEKRKTVTELELEIQALSRSTSARDRKLLAEKQQELADARAQLQEFETEHALADAEKALDLQLEKEEDRLNKEIESIDNHLENQYKVQQDALNELKQIKNFSKQSALYKEMRDWNRQNGTGKDADIDALFTDTAAILKAMNAGSFGAAMNALKGKIGGGKRSFAAGTYSAPDGLAIVDEQGYEVKLSNPSAGKYQFLNDGDIIFIRAESRFLKRLADSGGMSLIQQRLAGLLRRSSSTLSPLTAAATGPTAVTVRTGDIVINGDATKRTVSQIKAAQKDMTYQILRQFQKLK